MISQPTVTVSLSQRATNDEFVKTVPWYARRFYRSLIFHQYTEIIDGDGDSRFTHPDEDGKKTPHKTFSSTFLTSRPPATNGPVWRGVKPSGETRRLASEIRERLVRRKPQETQAGSWDDRFRAVQTLRVAFEQFPGSEEREARTLHSTATLRLVWKMEACRFGWQRSWNDECLRDTSTVAWN